MRPRTSPSKVSPKWEVQIRRARGDPGRLILHRCPFLGGRNAYVYGFCGEDGELAWELRCTNITTGERMYKHWEKFERHHSCFRGFGSSGSSSMVHAERPLCLLHCSTSILVIQSPALQAKRLRTKQSERPKGSSSGNAKDCTAFPL